MENGFRKVIIGSGISIAFTIIALIVFSCLLTYTNMGESTIPSVTIIITIISILIGSTIATSSLKKNGIMNGFFIGGLYIFLIYFLSSIIEKNFSLDIYSIIMILSSIIAGCIGGIIGVNKRNMEKNN